MSNDHNRVVTIIFLSILCFMLLTIVIVLSILYSLEKNNKSKQSSPKGIDTDSASYCGPIEYDDPRAFGPIIWPALHIMAQYYPENPSDRQIEEAKKFIQSMPWMLPCGQCGSNFIEFTEYNEDNAGNEAACMGTNEDDRCMTLDEICASKDNMVSFFVRAHNNVSSNVHPEREPFTSADAARLYTETNTCFHNKTFPGKKLDKSRR